MKLEIFFDYASPFAYLGAMQAAPVAARHGAELAWSPFLLGGLFKALGTPNVPLAVMPEAKRAQVLLDLDRWAEHWGVDFAWPSRFPMNTVAALRMTLLLPNEARGPLVRALFRAYWVEDGDLADPATLCAVADSVGLDGAILHAAVRTPRARELLFAATRAAEEAGVCGAPCFRVGRLLFWGQDRLAFVEKALDGWVPARG
ncbi:MAG: 2-hydroxychromene-2-carboxylate isomerase [Polyangiaceae bacterium]|nr:2-hydroxychromene-2-carboxylate isomerase [Polyangiaceae bacterium]